MPGAARVLMTLSFMSSSNSDWSRRGCPATRRHDHRRHHRLQKIRVHATYTLISLGLELSTSFGGFLMKNLVFYTSNNVQCVPKNETRVILNTVVTLLQ